MSARTGKSKSSRGGAGLIGELAANLVGHTGRDASIDKSAKGGAPKKDADQPTGLESDAEDEEAKKPPKRVNVANIGEVISKSRNMNAQVKRRKKERIYEAQLAHASRVRPKMLACFAGFKQEKNEPELDEDCGDSPSPAKDHLPEAELL